MPGLFVGAFPLGQPHLPTAYPRGEAAQCVGGSRRALGCAVARRCMSIAWRAAVSGALRPMSAIHNATIPIGWVFMLINTFPFI